MTIEEEENINFLKRRIEDLEKEELNRSAELLELEPVPYNYAKEQQFLNEHPLELMNINYSVITLLKEYEDNLKESIVKIPLKLPNSQQLNKAFGVKEIGYWGAPKNIEAAYIRGLVKGAQYIINMNK